MPKPKPPVPLPRTKHIYETKSFDEELLKVVSARPQPPQRALSCTSTPPPTKQNSEESETGNEYIVICNDNKVESHLISSHLVKAKEEPVQRKPPPLPAWKHKESLHENNETLCGGSWSDFNNDLTSWTDVERELCLHGSLEAEKIKAKGNHLYKALRIYDYLMSKHGDSLKQHIAELYCIADNLSTISKRTKIAGITGGATSVAGGVAAAAGLILSPFTFGASLALTAVGVGVATAGGVTGASAAIAHKAYLESDKKKIDQTLNDFNVKYEEILACLKFINEGIEQLKQYGLTALTTTPLTSRKAAKAVKVAIEKASSIAAETSIKASGMIEGFALGMDMYFIKGKDGQTVKKGLESALAMKIRKLAEDLDKGLGRLVEIKYLFV
ncbi:apolipoprotein L3-like [Odontesthes bonariensis]|uniref:apolipoprotein L3-like n=1 Tax=Odontesthes bonariensis TaxID=219752 RepID=UPI003F58A2EE